MFADFVRATPPFGLSVRHHVIIDSPTLAPRFSPIAQGFCASVSSPTQRWGIPLPKRPHALRARRRLQLIRQAKPDLILAWNQFTDFRIAALQLPCPLIYYEHGMSWYSHNARQLQGFLPYVSGALAASHAAKRMLQLKHKVAFPVIECRNPQPPHTGQGDTQAQSRTLDLRRPLRLGLAGRLVPLKAASLLVLTILELRTRGVAAEALICGEGPERHVIEETIARHKLTNHVRLLGQIEDMKKFYRALDIFISTSMHETCPLVCLEASAHGLPIIASQVDGFPEVVQNGVNGLLLPPRLTPENYRKLTSASIAFSKEVYSPNEDTLVPTRLLCPTQIADAILDITSSNVRYTRFSQAALHIASSTRTHAQYIKDIYNHLLEFSETASLK